jgi:hypothetical protein
VIASATHLTLFFTNSADTSTDLAENGIDETDSFHPTFVCDYSMPLRRSKQNLS